MLSFTRIFAFFIGSSTLLLSTPTQANVLFRFIHATETKTAPGYDLSIYAGVESASGAHNAHTQSAHHDELDAGESSEDYTASTWLAPDPTGFYTVTAQCILRKQVSGDKVGMVTYISHITVDHDNSFVSVSVSCPIVTGIDNQYYLAQPTLVTTVAPPPKA